MSSSSTAIHSIATNRKNSSRVNLPYLPDDLLLNCLARVSRLYYPTLSLVSKRFRSLLASKELYKTRTLLGCTESCLYVYLFSISDPRWFTLCRRPTRIPNPNLKKSTENCLVMVRTRNYPPELLWWTVTTIGSSIYLIGDYAKYAPSSSVLFMDCRSHTWRKAPSMQIARNFPDVSILDGKIYVVGGGIEESSNSSNLIECFDPNTQKWEDLPSPSLKIRRHGSLAMEGKLYLFGEDKNVVYMPKENRWDVAGEEMELAWDFRYCSCVIDNVFYRFGISRILEWYDFEGRSWRVLKGLEEVPELPDSFGSTQLVDYGGKIALLWEENVDGSNEKNIWCAEITLKKHNKHEIYGKIEWCDVVISESHDFFELVSVTV